VPPRFEAIEIILLSVAGIMLAFFATAHLVVVPAMLDSFREFGLIAPPATELAMSKKGLLLVEIPGVTLFCFAAASLWRRKKKLGSCLIGLCMLTAFAGGAFFVYSLSLPKPASAAAPPLTDVQTEH